MSQKPTLVRLTATLMFGALLAVGVTGGGRVQTAHATPLYTCYGNVYCSYHAQGDSGTGANGTGIQITTPDTVNIYGSSDGVSFHAFIMNHTNFNDSLEAGVLFGEYDFCGGTNYYFFPYGTRDDGATEAGNCGYFLANNYSYVAKAWSWSSNGYSALLNTSGKTLWQQNWGNYDMYFGWNLTEAEVHVTYGERTKPSWSGLVDMFHGQWLDGSDHWNYWSYTDTSDDCPYKALYYSPDAWQARSNC